MITRYYVQAYFAMVRVHLDYLIMTQYNNDLCNTPFSDVSRALSEILIYIEALRYEGEHPGRVKPTT